MSDPNRALGWFAPAGTFDGIKSGRPGKPRHLRLAYIVARVRYFIATRLRP